MRTGGQIECKRKGDTMRLAFPDRAGYVQCPQCKTRYKPDLEFPAMDDNRSIQSIYPDSEPYQREQLMTGYCSDKCFDEALGVEGHIYTKGKRFILTTTGSRRALFPAPPP